MRKAILRVILIISWLLNAAALLGFFLLRRRMDSPEAQTNVRRFHIIRAYKTDTTDDGEIEIRNEAIELELMTKLFAAAREYGNARVIVVTNNGDPGLDKIRKLAEDYADIVQVIEAPLMPANTISGQVFNHKVGWQVIAPDASDEDILLTTDCDSDLTAKLLRQIAKAYEDSTVGGVSTYAMYHPAVDWAAMPTSMVVNLGFGYLVLDMAVRGRVTMIGNLLSVRVSVYNEFGGFAGYNHIEEMVDDMGTTKKVLSTGKQVRLAGTIAVWNRYSTWRGWWERWTRWAISLRIAVPDIFILSPIATYGTQTLNLALMLYGVRRRKVTFMLPFFANWGIIWLYASITKIWREALFAPISGLLNLSGWLYALIVRPKQLKWRGTIVKVKEEK